MRWDCLRCGEAAGEKTYDTPATARRYAAAFDREDREAIHRRPGLLSLLPLRVYSKLRGGGQ